MNQHDYVGLLGLLNLIPAQTLTETTEGAGVDLLNHFGNAVAVLDASAGAAGTSLNVKIQDSVDNSSFADVAGLAFTAVTTAAAQKTLTVPVDKVRRYVRAVATLGGGTPSFTVALELFALKTTE